MKTSPKLLLGASGLALTLALSPVIAQQIAPTAPDAVQPQITQPQTAQIQPQAEAPVTAPPTDQPVVGSAENTAPLKADETPAKQAQVMPDSFADLVDKVSPAVVNITTTAVVAAAADGDENGQPRSPFDDLFRDFGGPQGEGPDGQTRPSPFGNRGPQRSNALGSGFVISADGFVVTNNHVIEGADEIEIEFKDGHKRSATVVGTDPKTDIALLKVEGDNLPFVTFGDSDTPRVGDWVLALGNPLGQGFSASTGIISARNRALTGTYDDFIQTDAAINRGNSGGPLFNMDGQVIGVNTAILSPNGGSIGIGFSMASNVVAKVVQQLEEYGETRRGWLGVSIQDADEDLADAMNLPEGQGAVVSSVQDGPAKDAGVEPGDVIITIDGKAVKDSRDLVRQVADAPIGQPIPVVVMRKGEKVDLDVTLGRRELAEPDAEGKTRGAEAESRSGQALGMTLQPLTPEIASELGAPAGTKGLVVTEVDPEGVAADKGIAQGDVITEVGQKPIATTADLDAQVNAARDAGRKSVLMLIRREGQPRFVALPVGKK